MKNKKGEEKLFSIWWFLVLLVVGVCVSYMTVASYSVPQDVRHIEVGFLYTQIENCIVKDNFVNTKIFEKDFDLYRECNLNEKVFNESFYVNVSLFSEGKLINSTRIGANYQTECEIFLGGTKAENYPKCIFVDERVFYLENGVKKGGVLEIVAGSNNHGKRIPQK